MQFLWDQGFPPIQIRNTAYNWMIGVRLKAAQVTIQQKKMSRILPNNLSS